MGEYLWWQMLKAQKPNKVVCS